MCQAFFPYIRKLGSFQSRDQNIAMHMTSSFRISTMAFSEHSLPDLSQLGILWGDVGGFGADRDVIGSSVVLAIAALPITG